MTDSSQPIAGWYPDPENAAAERWWDGTAWSDHRRASTVPVAPAPPAAPAATAPAAPSADVPPVPAPEAFAAPGTVAAPAAAPYGQPATSTPAYPAAPAYGAPAYPAGAGGYGAPVYTPAQPTNSLAIVGFVIALGGIIVSFAGLTSLAGAIISIVALQRANRMRAQGIPGDRWGLALGGVIAGFAIFVVVVGLVVLAIVFAVSSAATSNDPTTFG